MSKKVAAKCMVFAVFSCMAASVANAGIIYSNYGPGLTYNTQAGWSIATAGANMTPPFQTIMVAMPFTPVATAALFSIEVNVGLSILIPTQLDLTLLTDSNGSPGSIVETFSATSLPVAISGGFAATTILSSLHPVLSSGQQYWLEAADHNAGGSLFWGLNSIGDNGTVWLDVNGVPQLPTGTRGVFELDSAATPEPAGWILAATGILAVTMRRKFARAKA